MTLQQFRQVMRQHRYEPNACGGQRFQPRRQESTGSPSNPLAANHALLELGQAGWLHHAQFLRPAQIIIHDCAESAKIRSSLKTKKC
jgi:molecular chaperone GrpE (heat shock protein)